MRIEKISRKLIAVIVLTMAIFANLGVSAYAVEGDTVGIGNLTKDDIIAGWYFDDENGSVVKDVTGKYNGTCNGTNIVDTPYGKGRSFKCGDSIDFANAIIPKGEKSIRFKFKSDNIESSYSVVQTIICNTNMSSKGSYGTEVGLYRGRIFFNIRNSKETKIIDSYTDEVYADNKWHDVLVTWDGTINESKVKIYVDDMKIPKKISTAKSLEIHQPSNDFRIGKQWNEFENHRSFEGELAQIEIYDEYYMPPSPSTNLVATGEDAKVILEWDKVDNVKSYEVLRSTTSGGPYNTVLGIVYKPERSYIDEHLDNGTTYYYVIRAIQNGVKSINSNEASATPTSGHTGGGETNGNKALLKIIMLNGRENEYDITMTQVKKFLDWYENGKGYYVIEKNHNMGPFVIRKDYLAFDKIMQFEIMEYKK
ncbi:MAG: LamG domain-containing protein [Anaeromicrobium sp.]|jgi:hypothetical protein|uniref:LamG-like jellyroll fold domain-containing protein n=1 Tax=Anaeromicrobium sp. TaxID=1929132 RepID=UPI0025F03B00|nr:LamG-like jellyroll fold domain-containing protein [Anaeromicrobium sp.]MCT4593078.1 LamG domain-containing protein [Anaeromicrobium sp.]